MWQVLKVQSLEAENEQARPAQDPGQQMQAFSKHFTAEELDTYAARARQVNTSRFA